MSTNMAAVHNNNFVRRYSSRCLLLEFKLPAIGETEDMESSKKLPAAS